MGARKKKYGLVIIVKDYGRLHQASFKYSELTDYAKSFRKEYEHINIEIPKDEDQEYNITNTPMHSIAQAIASSIFAPFGLIYNFIF